MVKGKIRIFVPAMLLIAMSALFVQCEKDIELDLKKEGGRLVIYSFIYPDSAFSFSFSKSIDVLSEENYSRVENGSFMLYINDSYQGKYDFPSDTIWWQWNNFRFSPGDSVMVKAMDDTGDTATVSTYLPHVVAIEETDSVSDKYQGSDGILYEVLKCNITFTDPPVTTDYYQLEIIQERWEDTGGKETYHREVVDYIKDDPVFYSRDQEGALLEGLDFQGLFTDELIHGTYDLQCLIPSTYYELYPTDKKIKLTFYLYHHTADYYRYFRTKLTSDYYKGVPIFEPVNAYSNVIDGIGLVTGMVFSEDSLIFAPDE